MLNNSVIMGRLTKDIEIKKTTTGTSVASFAVAVERIRDGVDFIPCVAFNGTAEFIAKHFSKGNMIAVDGELRTRSYKDKNDINHNVMEILVHSAYFTGERRKEAPEAAAPAPLPEGYEELPLDI